MIRRMQQLFVVLSAASLMTGCGSDKAIGTNVGVGVSAAVQTATSKVEKVADTVGDTGKSFGTSRVTVPYASGDKVDIGTVWTTADQLASLSNVGTVSLQQWFIDEFNEDFTNSNGAKVTFAGRIANALAIFCYLDAMSITNDDTNLPADGTHVRTFTSDIISQIATACNDDASDLEGYQVTLTVSPTSNTTYYDKYIEVQLPGSESCPYKFYARSTTTETNIATSEDQTCDGRDKASQSVFHYNATTQVSKFFYVSKAFSGYPAGFEIYRGYLDESADEAYVVGFYGGDQDGTAANLNNYVSFTVAGKPTAGGKIAVSATTKGQTLADGTYNGCINSSDSSDSGDGDTLACAITGTASSSTHTAVVEDIYDDSSAINDLYNIGETTTVGFTDDSDIYL